MLADIFWNSCCDKSEPLEAWMQLLTSCQTTILLLTCPAASWSKKKHPDVKDTISPARAAFVLWRPRKYLKRRSPPPPIGK